LKECDDCRNALTMLEMDAKTKEPINDDLSITSVKKYTKKIKKRRKIIIFSILLLIIIIAASLFSAEKFHTLNPFSSGIGFIRIMFTNVDHVEIQHSPRIIIVKPDISWQLFLDLIKKEGYSYAEDKRMGAILSIEKNGVTVHVIMEMNRYYTIFTWDK